MSQNLQLAWKQLTFDPGKLLTAIAGVMVAVMLMWVQLGILEALYASATLFHRRLQADLVVMHPLSENMNKLRPFSTRTLYRFRGDPDVTQIGELFVGNVDWRNPASGETRAILMYGLEPDGDWVDLPGLREHAVSLREEDTFLFDQNSKAVFGPVVKPLREGKTVEVEVAGRRSRAIGLTAMAASFGGEGNLVASRANFLRYHPQFDPAETHVGLIRVRPGADVGAVLKRHRRLLAPEAIVLSHQEFIDFELRYWKTNAPVGFVFTMGTVIGFFIGFIVVYQILYTDVSNHLPQFATMKAMGFSDNALLLIVLQQGLYLSILGYIPGSILAILFYKVIEAGTAIPVAPTWQRAALLLALTSLMCLMSGGMATRRLRAADPADVF